MMIAGMRRLRSLVIFSSETYWLGHTGAFQGISVMKWHLRKDNSKVHGCRQEQNWDVNGSLQKGQQWIDRNMKIYILNFKSINLHFQWSCKKQGHLNLCFVKLLTKRNRLKLNDVHFVCVSLSHLVTDRRWKVLLARPRSSQVCSCGRT